MHLNAVTNERGKIVTRDFATSSALVVPSTENLIPLDSVCRVLVVRACRLRPDRVWSLNATQYDVRLSAKNYFRKRFRAFNNNDLCNAYIIIVFVLISKHNI